MKTAAILARVSTPGQNLKHGIPNQIAACKAYAERAGLEVCGTYVDAISGASETRESLYRLIDEADRYDAVIVYHLDRVGRDEELSHKFIRLLREAGLEVHASNRGLVERNFQTSIEIAVSAEERRNIILRTQAGLLAQAKAGKLPNGIHTYGYVNVRGTGTAEVNPVEADVVRRIYRLSGEGMGYRAIAVLLNEEGVPSPKGTSWSHIAPGRIIRNTAYKGEYRWRRNSLDMVIRVPAIVSPGEWEAAQKRRRGPPPSLGRSLSGHIRCGVCGYAMGVRKIRLVNGHTFYYRCNRRQTIHGHCGAGFLRADVVEPLVDREVRRVLRDEARVLALLELAESRPVEDTGVVAALRQEEERLLEALQKGFITVDEFGRLRGEVQRKIRAHQQPVNAVIPVEAYARAADELPLKELLEFANVTVVAMKDSVQVTIKG